MQQVGGALSLACPVTFALRHASGEMTRGVPAGVATTHGYVLAFRIGAALLALAGLLALVLLQRVSSVPRNPAAESLSSGRPR